MIAIPAVDLREGACVQLVGGNYADERIRLADPVAVATKWRRLGFSRLHVVDLDAATGRGTNTGLVRAIATAGSEGGSSERAIGDRRRPVGVQAGGGVRSDDAVQLLLDAGAERAIVGTRALEHPDWLATIAGRFPGRLVLAADVRNGQVVTHGWQRTLPRPLHEVIAGLEKLPLAAVLVTAVDREGLLEGPDLELMAQVAATSPVPVQASGGITTLEDLRALAGCGVAGAVIGMALYTGALDPRAAAEEFGT